MLPLTPDPVANAMLCVLIPGFVASLIVALIDKRNNRKGRAQ